jgi:hypothetical protein
MTSPPNPKGGRKKAGMDRMLASSLIFFKVVDDSFVKGRRLPMGRSAMMDCNDVALVSSRSAWARTLF